MKCHLNGVGTQQNKCKIIHMYLPNFNILIISYNLFVTIVDNCYKLIS